MMLLAIILLIAVIVLALLYWGLRVVVRRWLGDDMQKQAILLVVLLVVQFILGMLANLFQNIPKVKPYLVFHEVGPIALHTANATVILFLAIIFRILSAKKKRMEVPAGIGGTGVGVAYLCGILFVNGGQNNLYSFVMSLGFVMAIVAFSYAAFSPAKVVKRSRRS
jgi:hypothetical protein